MLRNQETRSIIEGFVESVRLYPEQIALEVDDKSYSYKQLGEFSKKIAEAVSFYEMETRPLAALLAYRSPAAYAGVLGILLSGKGYVPLNPEFPTERTLRMLTLSKVNVLIVGKECLNELTNLLPLIKQTLTIILPDSEEQEALLEKFSSHHYIFSSDFPACEEPIKPSDIDPDQTAYLLFTSGSTGIPKGVPVSHKNVCAYVDYICRRYEISSRDRFSQTFDMTFDLSVHDMFVCWQKGACLCSVPKKYTMAPAKFIKDKQLTMWFSVPSVAMFMSKFRMLSPDAFGSLRYSLFCGEPLSAVLAAKWQESAPNSVVENLYGPTEATIAISHYTWNSKNSPEKCVNGVVPIGTIFEGQKGCLVDQEFLVVKQGQPGELCLSGSQVTHGYLNNPEKTQSQYIQIPALGHDIWYRTGDLVKRDEQGCLYYLGRIDSQVKILGHRVELQEIDCALREAAGTEMALSIAWPVTEGNAAGVVGFIGSANGRNEQQILEHCKKVLPEYMVPKKLYYIDEIPLNNNGKLDRSQLESLLEQGAAL